MKKEKTEKKEKAEEVSNHTTVVITNDVLEILKKEKQKVSEYLGETRFSFSQFFKVYVQGISNSKLIKVLDNIKEAKKKVYDIIDGKSEEEIKEE